MPKATGEGAGSAGAPFTLPADLGSLTVEQLDELRAQADAEVDAILDAGKRPEDLARFGQVAKGIKALDARKAAIESEAAETAAEFDKLMSEIRPAQPTAVEGEPVEGDEVVEGEVVAPDAAPAPQLITASAGKPVGGAVTASRDTGGLAGGSHRINTSLTGIRQAAPAQAAPQQPLAITASTALPGRLDIGQSIPDMAALGDLMENRAQSLANQAGRFKKRRNGDPYGGVQVASIRNDWGKDVFNDKTSVDVVAAYIERVKGNRSIDKFETLVAAGGWCAPSQIRYDFFNLACQSGMIDLPTFGVERGGIQFPISPSLADTFSPALPWYTEFSNSTVPWLWTDGDDILAVTGSPTKPCIRVPCSDMDNVRLECYGICLTAGNLADSAWPESTRNFLQILQAAHYHASNARYISQISSLAVAVTGCTAAGSGAAAPILATAELSAWDYRTKYGMCRTDVIEWVLPEWSLGMVRADLAKRTGVSDFMAVPDAEIERWFDVRGIRVQFVSDYQVRASGQPGAATAITQYPSTVRGLMYAAGTVARGNGMSLDLGVVRDSTLNETNDFTAAWMEECHLIAQFGHEVREYIINVCPDGTTGAADLTSCCP